MHDTLSNVELPKGGEWIDVYTALGIAIGTPLTIRSLSANSAKISIQDASPESADGHQLIIKGQSLTLDEGSSGVWASSQAGGSINVTPVIAIGANVDAWLKPKVVNDFSLFKGYFTFDVPPSSWLVYEDDTEIQNSLSTRATSVDGYLNLKSGVGAGDNANIESRRHPGYQPNRGLLWSSSIGFKDANKNGILRAGLFVRDENGAYFKTKGDGKLYACIRSLGVETHEEEIIFPFAIDITIGNIYDIQLQWRGVGNIKFYAGNQATGALELVHTIKFLNTLDQALSISNPAMSASFFAENITEEVSLWCGCIDVTSEGGQRERMQYGSESTTRIVTFNTINGIIAMRSPHFINGLTNTRDMRLVRISVQANGKCKLRLHRTRDATAIAAGAWDVPVAGSFVEFNTTMTSVDPAKMAEFLTIPLAANQFKELENPDKDIIDFIIIHGDIIVLDIIEGNNIEVDATIEYGEEI